MEPPDHLVSTRWLASRLQQPGLRVVDASWYQPAEGRDAHAEFLEAHIPGACFIDLEAVAAIGSPLPHTIPSAAQFEAVMSAAGIGSSDTVVVYDVAGLRTSARLWWLLRYFGHPTVAVLDGGLRAWRMDGGTLAAGPAAQVGATFRARAGGMPVVDAEAMLASLGRRGVSVIDARPRERFLGEAPEPRPGLRRGHIPGSVCLPLADVVDPRSGRLLPASTLQATLAARGIDPGDELLMTCGSGVAAAALVWVATLLERRARLYDGSWCDWGLRHDLPVAGPAEPQQAARRHAT